MTWFAHLKISGKIITVVVANLLLMLCLGAFAVLELSKVNGATEEIATNWLPSVHAVDTLGGILSDIRRQELQLILSSTKEDQALYLKRMADVEGRRQTIDAGYVKLISSPEEKKLYDDYRAEWSSYQEEVRKEVDLAGQNKHDEAVALNRGDATKHFLAAMDALEKDALLNKKGGDDAYTAAQTVYSRARILISSLIVAAAVVGMCLALLVARVISLSLKTGVSVAESLARGDLSVAIEVRSKDETGQLMAALKTMAANLRSMVGQVAGTATQVAAAASQLHATADRIATGAEQVAAQSDTVATAGEEMSATSGDIAQTCQMAAAGALRASQSAQSGAGVVAHTITVMGQIAEQVQQTARTVANLGA